ncbi:DUF3034 family protein [Saccharospirillum salsuginis]|uniref:DUF3034 family protein n=1 Tax=Saccharospirillum salsuginis TaxID=418750 RepID=A0A918KMN5_9GAMM|nr:DUF3034 family protein [Saccharospirillum salsuginis]GGX67568.1 hypothetical protein GCM10007392_39000 [Saccharospirillum salsuginis]
MPDRKTRLVTLMLTGLLAGPAFGASKILATSGAGSIEGAAGGGLVPWAVIGGYGSDGEWGAAASLGRVDVDDFRLGTASVLAGVHDRLEVSFAQQTLQVEPLDAVIEQHVYGVKTRVAGHLIYGRLPQLSFGLQHKVNQNPAIATDVLGANSASGTDTYIAASKLYLHALFERDLLLNGTLRYTDANQTGLLGFGNSGGEDPQLVGEASVGLFLNPNWAIGAEYRQKPDRLDAVDEDAWRDVFVAWFPNKRVSVVGAYADLGSIALWDDQQGWYLSVQITN